MTKITNRTIQFLVTCIALLLLSAGDVFADGRPTLFVFVPSEHKSVIVEHALQAAGLVLGAMKDLNVTSLKYLGVDGWN